MIDIILLTLSTLLLLVSLILCLKTVKRFRGRFLLITIGTGAVAGILGSLVLNMWGKVVLSVVVAILFVYILAVLLLAGEQIPPPPVTLTMRQQVETAAADLLDIFPK